MHTTHTLGRTLIPDPFLCHRAGWPNQIIKDDLEETINSTFTDNEHADDEDESDGDGDDEEDDEMQQLLKSKILIQVKELRSKPQLLELRCH